MKNKEMIRAHAAILEELELEIGRIKKTQLEMVEEIEKLKNRVDKKAEEKDSETVEETCPRYFTVAKYGEHKEIRIDLKKWVDISAVARDLSEMKGYEVKRVKNDRFGPSNSYHESVLEEAVRKVLGIK